MTRPSAFSLRASAFSLRASALGLQPAAFGLQVVLVVAGSAFAQQPVASPQPPPVTTPVPAVAAPASVVVPPPVVAVPGDYTIGPDDILSIVFWRDKDMSADVVVRPDGRITLPLVNDIVAAGLTPDQLREQVRERATKFIEDPSVSVVVKQINSRKVFVTGLIARPGAYPLGGPITVLQMLSIAGGVNEYADDKKILIMRNEGGRQIALKFNFRDVRKGKNLQQNILLKPGDTIVIP